MTQEPHPTDTLAVIRALKRSLWVFALVPVLAIGWWFTRPKPPEEKVIARGTVAAPKPIEAPIDPLPTLPFKTFPDLPTFIHESGARGDKLLPETMGSGLAIYDLNGDGALDLLFNNGTPWPKTQGASPTTPHLWLGDGKGHFQDATKAWGLDVALYGTGLALGDIDSDGDPDLYLAALGSNRLFLNQGNRFEEVPDAWGAAGDATTWSTSAGFFDYDRDGDLDLFVCNYVVWDAQRDHELNFTLDGRNRAYGPPLQYPGTDNYLFRNDGGQFREVGAELGIQVRSQAQNIPMGKALAVTFADLDRDGWLDILVANDTVANFVFHNQAGKRFEEIGVPSGIAYDAMGVATGAMGIDAAWFGNNDQLGVVIANFANESTGLYVQQPGDALGFADMANTLGIGSPSRLRLSFGVMFLDVDLDGLQDILQANGHLEEEIQAVQASQTYLQPAQLFLNRHQNERSHFVECPADHLGDLALPLVGRACGYGDLDNDGDLDVVLGQTGGPVAVLRNDQSLGNHWIRIRLVGKTINRDAIGAVVELVGEGFRQRQQVMPTRSYLTQVEPTLTFGLGKADRISRILVHWTEGSTQELGPLEVDQVHTIQQP